MEQLPERCGQMGMQHHFRQQGTIFSAKLAGPDIGLEYYVQQRAVVEWVAIVVMIEPSSRCDVDFHGSGPRCAAKFQSRSEEVRPGIRIEPTGIEDGDGNATYGFNVLRIEALVEPHIVQQSFRDVPGRRLMQGYVENRVRQAVIVRTIHRRVKRADSAQGLPL